MSVEENEAPRQCPKCRAYTRKGERCAYCRCPDPETQPKKYRAWTAAKKENA